MRAEYHDYQRHDFLVRLTTEQQQRIATLEHELAVALARMYRMEQRLAIQLGDKERWAKATAALMACGVGLDEVEAA